MYICATSDGISGSVLCIGNYENQKGVRYNDAGIWCDFTFDYIPEPSRDLLDYVSENNYTGSILKVYDGSITCKTKSDISQELPPSEVTPEV